MAQDIYIKFKGDASGLLGQINKVENALKGLSGATQTASANLDRIEKRSKAAGISLRTVVSALAALGAGAALKGIVSSYMEFEKYKTVLTTFLGSSQKANAELARLQTLANSLPQDLSDITNAFTIFTRMGIDASSKSLTAFSNIATANGKSLTQLAEAVADGMTGEFERFKEFGIKVSKEGDNFVARIGDQQVALSTSTKDLVGQLMKLGEEGGRFGSAAANNAGTLTQAFSNLRGSIFSASVTVGEMLAPALIAAANAIAPLLNNAELVEAVIKRVASYAVAAAVAWAGYTAAVAIAGLVTGGLTAALVLLRTALIRTGIGVLVIAAGELVYQFIKLTDKVGGFANALGFLQAYASEVWSRISQGMSLIGEEAWYVGQAIKNAFGEAIAWVVRKFANFTQTIIDGYNAVLEVFGMDPTEGKGLGTGLADALEADLAASQATMEQYRRSMNISWAALFDPMKTTVEQFNKDNGINLITDDIEDLGDTATQTTPAVAALGTAAKKMAEDIAKALEEFRKIPDALDIVKGGIDAFNRLNPLEGLASTYKTELAGLETLRNRDLVNEEEYLRTKAKLNQEYAAKVGDINKALLEENLRNAGITNQSILDAYTGFDKVYQAQAAGTIKGYEAVSDVVGGVLNDLGKYNKRAFEAAKAYNIAVAIMNTITGITKALGSYPPPWNFLAAAAVGAAGYAQVAQIRSQQYSGRALGGPVMGNTPYMVGENGPELFTPATSGNITRNNQLDSSSPVNINFTINAIDSRGIDEVLIQRKGVIQQIVTDAMMERGQRSRM
jgi:hypothetical protein